jgi:hypothetical protein
VRGKKLGKVDSLRVESSKSKRRKIMLRRRICGGSQNEKGAEVGEVDGPQSIDSTGILTL